MGRKGLLLLAFAFASAPALWSEGTVPLRLFDFYEGSCRLGRGAPAPAPALIAGAADWSLFVGRIPATLPDPSVMGGKEQPNQDPVLSLEPDFSRRFFVAVYQDASRRGPIRFDGVRLEGGKVVLRTTFLDRGPEARPVDLGFYTLFEFPRVAGLDAAAQLQYGTPAVERRPLPRMECDGTTGLYGIRGPDGPGWVVKPSWTFASDFDPWGHAVVSVKGGFALVDGSGKEILRPMTFDNGPDYFAEGLARYRDAAGRVGYFDRTGAVAIPAQWDFAEPFQDGAATVFRGGAMQKDGEHAAWRGGQASLIDGTGKTVGR